MKKITLIFIASCMASHSWAWGPTGHRIIAQVAYHYMSARTIHKIDAELGAHGMVYWAAWPDEIRSDNSIYPTSYDWHYQDMPAGMTDEQVIAAITDYPRQGGQLWRTMDTLTAQLMNVCRMRHPQDSVLYVNGEQLTYHDALVFLIHLTGDNLCPMHMAPEEDKGGNKLVMYWFGRQTNLHKVWDEDLIRARELSYTEYAQMLIDRYGDWKPDKSRQEYIPELYHTTQSIYAGYDAGMMTYRYIWTWRDTCDRWLYIAGRILAQTLNELYK